MEDHPPPGVGSLAVNLVLQRLMVDGPFAGNKFLACALEKKADFIVSRDPSLRNVKHYHEIQIIDATTFIEKVK